MPGMSLPIIDSRSMDASSNSLTIKAKTSSTAFQRSHSQHQARLRHRKQKVNNDLFWT